MHTHSCDVVQVPFYFKDENTENTCMFNSKVKLWNEAPSWCPPHLLHMHSKCFLSSTPSLKSCYALVFSGVLDTTGSCGLLGAPHKVPAFPLSYGPANSTHFYYPLEIALMFFCCEKPIYKSCESTNSSAGLSASVMDTSKVRFCP